MPTIKNYNADLRGKYKKYFEISLILSLSLIIAAFKLAPKDGNMDENFNPPQELITIENIINTVQKPKPPPPPPPKPDPVLSEPDEVPEEVEFVNEIDLNAKIDPPPPLPDPPRVIKDEPFIPFADVMPAPIGGLKVIQDKVEYTEIAKRIGIEATVFIEAKIDRDGIVVNAVIKKGVGGGLDESALRAVKLTKFYPGKQRGIPVKVKMVIPIKFVLR